VKSLSVGTGPVYPNGINSRLFTDFLRRAGFFNFTPRSGRMVPRAAARMDEIGQARDNGTRDRLTSVVILAHRISVSDPDENALLVKPEAKRPEHAPDDEARDNLRREGSSPRKQSLREGFCDPVEPSCPARVGEQIDEE